MPYPNLEAELSRSGITRLQVAALLGKNKSTISSWMHGNYNGFSVTQATAVRDAFFPEMSLDYLFSEAPLPNDQKAVNRYCGEEVA